MRNSNTRKPARKESREKQKELIVKKFYEVFPDLKKKILNLRGGEE